MSVNMTEPIAPLTERASWKALAAHYPKLRELHLRKLFADDPKRGERMTVEAAGVFLDYSKNRITDETLKLLLGLAEESGLRSRIDAMFSGEKINITEDRAVLHVALRAPRGASIMVDGKNVAEGKIAHTIPFRVSADETLDIGEDTGTPVSEDYHVPFKFTGTLNKVVVNLSEAKLSAAEQKSLDEAEGKVPAND